MASMVSFSLGVCDPVSYSLTTQSTLATIRAQLCSLSPRLFPSTCSVRPWHQQWLLPVQMPLYGRDTINDGSYILDQPSLGGTSKGSPKYQQRKGKTNYQVSPPLLSLLKKIFIFIYLFIWLHENSQLQHVESNSQTRDQTRFPCIESTDSQPLDHQGSPYPLSFLYELKDLGKVLTHQSSFSHP